MNESAITVQITVNTSLARAWDVWTNPDHIVHWAFAQDDWEAPYADNDLQVGAKFKTTMAAKDGSVSFDLIGTYTAVEDGKLLEYDMEDGRHVKIVFEETPEGILITETFDPENENPADMQRGGWQAILDNYKKRAESQEV